MNADEQVERIRAIYPDASALVEGGLTYVHLPAITIATRGGAIERAALLCPHAHGGYMTRLFLNAKVPGNLANWTEHMLFTRKWHSWSWNYVIADQPWTAILANHLAAFR